MANNFQIINGQKYLVSSFGCFTYMVNTFNKSVLLNFPLGKTVGRAPFLLSGTIDIWKY